MSRLNYFLYQIMKQMFDLLQIVCIFIIFPAEKEIPLSIVSDSPNRSHLSSVLSQCLAAVAKWEERSKGEAEGVGLALALALVLTY